MGMNFYTPIWRENLNQIIEIIRVGKSDSISLKSEDFKNSGNRKRYGFRAEFENGNCISGLEGSAVGRDLRDVLLMSHEFKNVCQGKFVVIRMGKDFKLHVEV